MCHDDEFQSVRILVPQMSDEAPAHESASSPTATFMPVEFFEMTGSTVAVVVPLPASASCAADLLIETPLVVWPSARQSKGVEAFRAASVSRTREAMRTGLFE
jgi:hypothetical protein